MQSKTVTADTNQQPDKCLTMMTWRTITDHKHIVDLCEAATFGGPVAHLLMFTVFLHISLHSEHMCKWRIEIWRWKGEQIVI